MKKFLLSLAVMCSAGFAANAETVTLTMADAVEIEGTETKDGNIQPMTSMKVGDYQFSFESVQENPAPTQMPTFWKKDNTLRMYIGCKMTISGGQIANAKEVVLNAKSLKGIAEGAENLPVAPGFEAAYDATAKTVTFTGAAAGEFVMTLPTAKVAGANPNYQILSITITYEEGGVTKQPAAMKFETSEFTVNFGDEFTAPELTKATTAAVEYASSNEDVAMVNEVTGKVDIVGLGSATITATAAENDEFYGGSASYTINLIKLVTVTKATSVSAGEFVFVAGGKYNELFDKNYGYMSVTDMPADAAEASFEANEESLLTFLAVDGGYNIATLNGKFLGAKDGFKTFDTTDDSAANRVWSVEIADDGLATITNVATGRIVYQDPQYGSFGAYTAEEAAEAGTYVLPTLYKLGNGSSVAVVEVEDADAPVEYFNLQGVRVSNPENGLYIRRQGSKVEKIVIR